MFLRPGPAQTHTPQGGGGQRCKQVELKEMVPGGVPRVLNLERGRHGKTQNLPVPHREGPCAGPSQLAGKLGIYLQRGKNNHAKAR